MNFHISATATHNFTSTLALLAPEQWREKPTLSSSPIWPWGPGMMQVGISALDPYRDDQNSCTHFVNLEIRQRFNSLYMTNSSACFYFTFENKYKYI